MIRVRAPCPTKARTSSSVAAVKLSAASTLFSAVCRSGAVSASVPSRSNAMVQPERVIVSMNGYIPYTSSAEGVAMKVRSAFAVVGILVAAVWSAFPSAADPKPAIAAPSCAGSNPHVAMPNAPHGMFVWVYWGDGERMTSLFKKYVIGKDPTLCGASIVVRWADIEKKQGVYDFSFAEALAKPFTDAGLTVNLLFAEATEGEVEVTPRWVMSQAPTTNCGGLAVPVYWNPKFEAMWSAFIKRSIDHFSNESPIKDRIGYLRFATGAGAEAVAPAGAYGNGPCAKPLKALGFSYDVWKAHTLKILDVMASVPTQHQIMAALPSIPGGKTRFEVTDAFAAAAAAN